MAINQDQLFQIICEQIESINKLTDELKSSKCCWQNVNIVALTQKITFASAGGDTATLAANAQRQGLIMVNMASTDAIYGIAGTQDASPNYFTWKIEKDSSEYYIPANGTYPGEINFYAPAGGYLMVTEFSHS